MKSTWLHRLLRAARVLALPLGGVGGGLLSCAIEPPLHLPQESVVLELPIVLTQLEVVWETQVNWLSQWWYGWDEKDEYMWGSLEYPYPTNYEVRRFYQGSTQSDTHNMVESFTCYGNKFKRRYDFGYHDMLFWSNIDSRDGTQTVLINEDDMDNVIATTTGASASYVRPYAARRVSLKKQPDIFYSGYERSFYISRDISDYDYYDEQEHAWVKTLSTILDPVVYIYLVQVVIYNNKGRIRGLADNVTLTGMAESVNLNTGHTSQQEVDVVFEMRMKQGRQVGGGNVADVIGGKFTTFGLCDMDSWSTSRGPMYAGTRTDLANNVILDFMFSNDAEAVFTYDVTRQVQSQAHGGVLTIEIDADTITIPTVDTPSGSGFKPTVEEYADSVVHEFGI